MYTARKKLLGFSDSNLIWRILMLDETLEVSYSNVQSARESPFQHP